MNVNIKEVNNFYKEQKNDPERQKKLKTYDEIQKIHEGIKAKCKKNPTMDNTVDLIISYLASGCLAEELPPRRILDYSGMKMRNYTEDENYVKTGKTGKCYFNQFKTKARIGSQTIDAPKELLLLINKWKKVNDKEYLLENEDGRAFYDIGIEQESCEIV